MSRDSAPPRLDFTRGKVAALLYNYNLLILFSLASVTAGPGIYSMRNSSLALLPLGEYFHREIFQNQQQCSVWV